MKDGFATRLVFLALPSPDIAVARVGERVRRGGHSVPETTVRRRFRRGLANFFELDRSIVTLWQFLQSAAPGRPLLIAHGQNGHESVRRRIQWIQMQELWLEHE